MITIDTITTAEAMPSYPFTNDNPLGERYAELAAFQQTGMSDQARQVAVIVGTGGLLSLADVVPDTVYMTDVEEAMPHWIAKQIDLLASSSEPDEYIRGLPPLRRPHQRDFIKERSRLGDHHFLSSQARFEQMQVAIGAKSLNFVQMDYREAEHIGALGEMLRSRDEVIAVFNATNVHASVRTYPLPGKLTELNERLPAFIGSLRSLPWADRYRIMASTMLKVPVRSLPLFDSLDTYFAATR